MLENWQQADFEDIPGNESEKQSWYSQKQAREVNKISIAYKEARETSYWLRILKDSDYLDKRQFESIYPDLEELIKIITKIIKTTKNY